MDNGIMDKITTNRYKTLKLMYYNQVKISNGHTFTPMTQVEIAEQIGVSKITMNSIFKDLQEEGLLYPYGTSRGKYCLTDNAIFIVNKIEEINTKIYKQNDMK